MTLDAECPWSLPLVCGMQCGCLCRRRVVGIAGWPWAGASERWPSHRGGIRGRLLPGSHACSGGGLMFEPAAVIAQTLAADAQQVLNQLAAKNP